MNSHFCITSIIYVTEKKSRINWCNTCIVHQRILMNKTLNKKGKPDTGEQVSFVPMIQDNRYIYSQVLPIDRNGK